MDGNEHYVNFKKSLFTDWVGPISTISYGGTGGDRWVISPIGLSVGPGNVTPGATVTNAPIDVAPAEPEDVMRVPRDKEGKPCMVGEKMEVIYADGVHGVAIGDKFEVCGYYLSFDGEWFLIGRGLGDYVKASDCIHSE